MSRLQITVYLALAVILWALVLMFKGIPLSMEYLAPFGTVVGSLVAIGILFDRVLWSFSWFHGWLVKRPDLRGTWKVLIRTDWEDSDKPTMSNEIKSFVGITQTYSSLQFHMMSEESDSWLTVDRISKSRKNDGYEIVGVYLNQPSTHLRGERSEIHYGAFVLNSHGKRRAFPSTLIGEYWTDRKSKGTMTLSERIPEVKTNYPDAIEAFRSGDHSREVK